MAYSVGLYTLGCKVSQYETEAIAEAFCEAGFVRRPFREACDVYVINTCTVTREADRKSRQCIRRALSRNPDARVLVCGCYSQTTPQEVAAIDGVSYVSGTYGKMRLPAVALDLLSRPKEAVTVEVTDVDEAPFEPMCVRESPRTRAYVKIEDGCECRCTYCAIPAARGRVRSKPMEDVLAEVKALADRGTEEVVLTGIETASWGVDLDGVRLIDLLEKLDGAGYVSRIRLGSLSPEVMTDAFIDRISRLRSVCPQFHVSMQSGSDTVLRGMKRRYNTARALSSMEKLRAAMPSVQFTTDMMVGFPGESEALFEETLDFTRRARFLDMHVFAYSRRRGTPADTYEGQVPEAVKAERSHRLTVLQNGIRDEILDAVVQAGTPLRMIPETLSDGVWSGHSDAFLPLAMQAHPLVAHGRPVQVVPLSYADGVIHVRFDKEI